MIKIKIYENQGCGGCGSCEECGKFPAEYSIPNVSTKERDKHMHTSDCEKPTNFKNSHNGEEARMHRTTLAHLFANTQVLLDLIEDADDLPEWLETKITLAGDYIQSAAQYIAGNVARDQGQLE
jgi:hypothetical protein